MNPRTFSLAQKLFFIFLLSTFSVSSQSYTWVRGSNVSGVAGNYGTMGTPSPTNDPGGRHGSAKWVDAAGNLWLFGGEGYSSVNTLCWLNDLWKYDLSTNQWTWIKGSNLANQIGAYGTIGVPLPSNNPGAREFPTCWVDNSGNFWMFGGDGFSSTSTFGRLSDLWKYNPTTNQWTWVRGFTALNQNGFYGILGVPTITNDPGARFGAAPWVDDTGDLWMFGGRGYAATGPGNFLNDLWKYNISSNQWTWINGSNTAGQAGSFGTINIPSPSNYPGAKEFPSYWKGTQGSLYLFGGRGAGYFNDLWRYDITGNTWTWIGGANVANQLSTYGPIGVPTSTTMPGGRFASACWQDLSGNFWLAGGTGWAASTLNSLNDLFRYDPCSAQWTWMKGSIFPNQSGVYGTQGIAAPLNNPGSRMYSSFWRDTKGKFWLFGGEGFDAASPSIDHLNDLWRYDANLSADSIAAFPSANLCSSYSATLSIANTFSAIVWYQSSTGTLSIATGSTYTTPPLVAVNSPTLYPYFAQAACLLKPRLAVTLTVSPNPSITITGTNQVCSGSSITLSASGATTYTWNTTATSLTISVVPTSTVYVATVIGTSTAGCQSSATKTITVLSLPILNVAATRTMICRFNNSPNGTTTLSASGAASYTWMNGVINSTIIYTTSSTGNKTVTVTGSDLNGCANSASIMISVISGESCVSIPEYQLDIEHKIYPNPSQAVINIELPYINKDPLTFEIYNCLGQMVFETKLNSENNVLRTGLSRGVYTYRIIQDHKFDGGKLLIE
ncbi:MAG: kelch repeat-containing protein [bacterium]|nr:kelch repeat-containing protein [bacterium]